MGLFGGGQKGSDSQPLGRPDPNGQYAVVLESAGSNKIAAIKAVRTLTEFELGPAKDIVTGTDQSPRVVVRYSEEGDADEAAALLRKAGAQATVRVGAVGAVVGGGGPVPPGTFVCRFCEAVGTGEVCDNCGAPRKFR